jgi:hypothetical protein
MPRPISRATAGLMSLSSGGLLLSLVACTTVPDAAPTPAPAAAAAEAPASAASGSASAAAGPARPAAPAAAPAPGSPPAFATVIKDARRTEGLLAVWQKEERVWFELKPEDFNKPMFLSPKLARGIGEQAIFGGSMLGFQPWGRPQIVEFRRQHNQVLLVARNERYLATAGSPEARSVASAFSDSLLGGTPVASQPHPESKAVLIDANTLFVSDLLGLGINLQRTYRQNYAFDGRNSAFVAVRSEPDEIAMQLNLHFATGSLSSATPGAPPNVPAPIMPNTLPDPRSMFLGVHYSLAALPARPMTPRRADPRVGYFTTTVSDFGNDNVRTPNRHYVRRWRLEKKDPSAAVSEPVQPITFWLDRDVPLKYRDTITRGVLAWNAAFERIGFKDALVVKQQPEDAKFDTLDLRVASIRWMTNADPAFGAIGPSHIDPRTGEILDADIGIESLSSRDRRHVRAQILAGRPMADASALLQSDGQEKLAELMRHGEHALRCEYGELANEQLGYALDVLESRGDIDPDSPEADAFVQAYLFDVTMHEVGHTLGLRHNFRSSRIYSDRQLSDPEFTRSHGLAGSVMEYAPVNLGMPGAPTPAPFQTTLGPYDYWAIEYAYKPLPEGLSEKDQEAELKAIAARSPEPVLAFGTDEDNLLGLDPESLVFDLGDDPLVFAKKRIAIAHELFQRQETRALKPTEDYAVLRRALGYALRDATRAAGVLARQIGGLRTLRDFPGSGRDPLVPVPVAVQREALDTLAQNFLSAGSFHVSPTLARKLAPDFLERFGGAEPVPTDFSLEAIVLDLQRALLNQLMSETLAARLLDAQAKAASPREAFGLSELYGRLSRDIWAELGGKGDIPSARRDLQREHLSRMANLLVRPSSNSRADARGLLRAEARVLLDRLQAASRRKDLSPEARAHVADSAETLRAALTAPLQRSNV